MSESNGSEQPNNSRKKKVPVHFERGIQREDGNALQGTAPIQSNGELVIGSAEYERKNERRFALIRKRIEKGLDSQEEAEFQALQAVILSVTKAA